MSQKSTLCVVILAGGSGTRFWPMSRSALPKQFLPLAGDESLLQATLRRVQARVSAENIYIVSNGRFKKLIASQVSGFKVPAKNILLEPSGKNTAPAIAWAASVIYSRRPDATMIVLPSDHLIQNVPAFLKKIDAAVQLAQSGYLVTLGIVPTRPETGYGYIKAKKLTSGIYPVEQFVEKPVLAKAKEYVRSRKYYWNSGMFIWKVSMILEEFKTQLPKIYDVFVKNATQSAVEKIWDGLEGISIDYGVMEKAKKVAVVPAADIGWSDVGSWEALWEVSAKDRQGNVIKGDVICHDSINTLVLGSKRLVACVGLENIVVVDTGDALLVCSREKSQGVKDIVENLKKNTRSEI